MPEYRIFVFEGGHIKEPAKMISCSDDKAAIEEGKNLLNGTDQSLEVWQRDRRVAVFGPSKKNEGAKAD
jgi:hypothetical protein